MKTLNFFISVSIILGLTFMLSSCDKDETEDQVTISQAEEASFVDNVYEDVSTEVDNVVIITQSKTLWNVIGDCHSG